ncbi:DUF1254 domain-containing protein [Microbacterium marmarense]|uniref:DUF1254 domain-containing protein n=1 Tax=Microbacterium marmarense TaxID=3122051 RepID=A0ABU8LR11_9MICO
MSSCSLPLGAAALFDEHVAQSFECRKGCCERPKFAVVKRCGGFGDDLRPDTDGRYYVLQFVDAWTNNFAYVGHRATGTGEGDFLLVPPGWQGEAPDGHTVIHVPTHVASIVGRWAVASDADLAVVHALQDTTTLTQLDVSATPKGIAVPDASAPEDVAFFEKMRLWSQQFAPAARDRGPVVATLDRGVEWLAQV